MINILCGIIGVIFFLRADANREKLDRYYRMDIDIEKRRNRRNYKPYMYGYFSYIRIYRLGNYIN